MVIAAMSPEKTPSVPLNHDVLVIPQTIQRGFDDAGRKLFHKMHIASSFEPIRHLPKTPLTRFAPSRWGVRRDDYECRDSGGQDGRSVAVFRKVAADMAHLIITTPIPTWRCLVPGSIEDAMRCRSRLHLADYWLLTLHHLVWSKKLPYPIERSWLEGTGFDDASFYMLSTLPVDLAEASHDALVLFQDAAAQALMRPLIPLFKYRETYPPRATHETAGAEPPEVSEPPPPECSPINGERCGRSEKDVSDETTNETAEATLCIDEMDDEEGETDSDDAALNVDDQSFTVWFGGATFRFTGRNKQLFALLERISRRPGFRVSFDDLRSKDDVWDGSPVEDSTIRGAVTRLRKLLKSHAMEKLADRIATGTYCGSRYVVLHESDDADD